MKLREVFRYEIEQRLYAPSTWIYAAFLFLCSFWILGATGDVGPVNINAPEGVARGSIVLGMFGLLVTAGLFGDAAMRDVRAEMDPLVYSTSLRKLDYLGGRFLGAFVANLVLALTIPAGLLVTTLLGVPDPAGYGPFRLISYVEPFFVFVIPNLVLSGVILFAVGVLTRQTVPVYLVAIGFFISSIVTANFGQLVENPVLFVLLDPVALAALTVHTELWTAAELNAQLIGLPTPLVANRLVWLAISAGVFGLLHRRFRFAHPDASGHRRRIDTPNEIASPAWAKPASVPVPRVAGTFGARTAARQTLAIARRSLAEHVPTRWFAVVVIACVGLTMLWGWNVTQTVFEASTWPVTLLVAGTVISQRSVPLLWVLVALYAGELVWKEREMRTSEISDAAPVPEGIALLGRFVALVAMLVTMSGATIVGGLLIQILKGYYVFEIGLYLRMVFGLNLIDCVLWAALVMTIHVVVNHKGLGHMFVALTMAFLGGVGQAFGFRHPLLMYGTDSGWVYSDMNGFGPFIGPFVWFKLYWASWALLLGVVAATLWVRGREPGLGARARLARARFVGPLARAGGVALLLIVSLGGFIYYNTNVLNEYVPRADAGAAVAELEKRYGQYEGLAQPTITDAELRVEIYPEEGAADLTGTYRLVNQTSVAIDSVHVFVPVTEVRGLALERAGDPSLIDEELGYRIYPLDEPLEPGASIELGFEVSFRPEGFTTSGVPTDVVRNGAYFNRRWMPFIGYQPLLELTDERQRERYGLPPKAPVPHPAAATDLELKHREAVRDADRVQAHVIIGTSEDHIAVTPGVLQRSWSENGRSYFHYRTEKPASFGATVFSARYAVLEDQWNGVDLSIFHDPEHTLNLDRALQSMKASLEYYSAEFDPYRGSQLRLVEIPRYAGFGGRAHPGTIAFTEDFFFGRTEPGDVDIAFYGTAHEVAHMWWGGGVGGAQVRGAGFISESLANYSAMMVTEKTLGPEIARSVYDFHMEYYLRGRAVRGMEMPLIETFGQPYIHYRKGSIAMYTLRNHIGEEAVNTALRRFYERYNDAGPPYPTSLDLMAELRAVTPDSSRHVVTDWFETVTLWDVEAWSASVEPTADGQFEVTLDVRARKMRADSIGHEADVPMDDLVEIGVFAPSADGGPDEALYLERHRIGTGQQTLTITVPREPAYAGIDPYNQLIDRNRNDNVVEIASKAHGS